MHTKTITILGSTGSIGTQTLQLVEAFKHSYQIVALTAQSNVELLALQAKKYQAKAAVIADSTYFEQLKILLAGTKILPLAGESGLQEAACMSADIVISAIVGVAGLLPTMQALTQGNVVALACKEALVCAGPLMIEHAKRYGATILPIDSEHNAVFQIFDFNAPETVEKVTLTASGGPFLHTPLEALDHVTKAQALKHPNWQMGQKITIDSATLVNKVLETIEARYLFSLRADQIQIVMHPESIVHSFVSYKDGSILAQLGNHDMRMPIQYVMTWPKREEAHYPKLDIYALSQLHFLSPEVERFPVIGLVEALLTSNIAASIIFNAANEVAVEAFLGEKIKYKEIYRLIASTLNAVPAIPINSLDAVMALNAEARRIAVSFITPFKGNMV